ncbi:MAG: hypothetical protein Phog2KO_14310 [Phototrophicaceae bacterium]
MTISLSSLIAPTPKPIINEHAELVQRRLVHICRQLDIYQEHLHEYNTMSAYLFPYANEQQLLVIGLYNNFLYYVDDTFDRHKELEIDDSVMMSIFKDAAKVFETGCHPENPNPITNAIFEIRTQLIEVAPNDEWFGRFFKNTIEHLLSSLETTDSRLPNESTSWFDYYNEIRDLDSGMAPTLDLIELALGYTIADDIYQNPHIKEAQKCVIRYCSLSNDLFSYDKEVVKFNSDFSAIVMLERDGYPFEEAVALLIDELNAMVTDFSTIYSRIRSKELAIEIPEQALFYMDCLWYQIVAAYHWQFNTNRYRSPESTFQELRTPLAIGRRTKQ